MRWSCVEKAGVERVQASVIGANGTRYKKGAALPNKAQRMPLVLRYEVLRANVEALAGAPSGSGRGESMLGPARELHNRIYFCKARA